MSIAAILIGSNQLTGTFPTATVTGTTTNGASWVAFAADTTGWGATPITDNKGNTFVQIGTNVVAFGVTGTLWMKDAGVGGASHTFTATAVSSDLISLIVVEITGGAASILDKFVTGNDDAASPFTSSVTAATTTANEVILAFEFDNRTLNAGVTWGNSYLSLSDLTNNNFITAAASKLNVTSTGTQQSSFTQANTTEAVSWIATFKEAGGVPAATAMGRRTYLMP